MGMRDPLETVTVMLGGGSFSGWESVSVTYAVEQAARTARLTVSDYVGAMPFMPGTPCELLASGETILTGYVRTVSPRHDHSDHSIDLEIVSRAVDAVECSVDHPTGFLKEKRIDEIAREFDSCGVGIVCDERFPVEARTYLNAGASLFSTVEPIARSHDALIYDTPEGQLRLAKKPRGRHSGALAIGDGGNIISASATLTEDGRHSPVMVRGQSSRGQGASALRIEGRATDSGVRRHRPRILVLETEATSAKVKGRAERAVKRAAGYSREAQITVVGWRDGAGRIWEPHFIVAVDDPRIYLRQDMAIKSVTLNQSMGEGTTAAIALCDPRALNGGAGADSDSDAAWASPEATGSVGYGG